MKVALYARVSSEMQVEKDLSINTQLKSLREYARKNGWDIYHEEFIDEAQSARTTERPAFERMIALAKRKPKPFDAILVWKFSRFARNRRDSVVYKALLRRHGVNVISITEPIDDSPAGELLEGIIEIVDEFYSKTLAQDSMRGLKEIASRGFFTGGPVPYGFRLVKATDGSAERTKLAIDKKRVPIVREIFSRYIGGQGARGIAQELNRRGIKSSKGKGWCTKVILQMLRNEKYIGTLTYHDEQGKKITCKNAHPAIIDEQTFRKAQEIRKKRAGTPPATLGSPHLLSGLAKCGLCNSSMTTVWSQRGVRYYRCKAYHAKGKYACKGVQVPGEKLERAVLDFLKQMVLRENVLKRLVDEVNRSIAEGNLQDSENLRILDEGIKDLHSRRHRIYDAIENGGINLELLKPRLKELTDRIKIMQKARERLTAQLAQRKQASVTLEQTRELVKNLQITLSVASTEEKRTLLSSFIEKIVVHKTHTEIYLKVPYYSVNSNLESYGVAWAGTAASPSDEWIELYNASNETVDLTGWTLNFGKTVIDLGSASKTTLAPGEYFLLERTSDDTIADIAADFIYTGTLSNAGTVIKLIDAAGKTVDTANTGQEKGWVAGNATSGKLPYASMERINPRGPDVPSNWKTNDGTHRNGKGAAGNPINGTPKAKNSATITYETVPRVQVTAPSEEGETISGVYVITWTANDPDGDAAALKIDVYLSADGGKTWNPLVSGLANSGSYAWDTSGISTGDNYQLKVVATDPNALSGEGKSPIFSVSAE